jgi:hypothetical protein
MAKKVNYVPPKSTRIILAEDTVCHHCQYNDCEQCVDLNKCAHKHYWIRRPRVANFPLPQTVAPRNPSSSVWNGRQQAAPSNLPLASGN